MAEEITAKIKNCFEDSPPEKEYVIKRDDGSLLCRFTVRQLTVYQIDKCRSDEPETLNRNLIKAGVVKFESDGLLRTLNDEALNKLTRSRLNGKGITQGLFEIMAAAVLGLNQLSEGEAKN